MKNDKSEMRAMGSMRGLPARGAHAWRDFLGVAVLLSLVGTVHAQTWSYGVPAAHDTQAAVEPPPAVSEGTQHGFYAGLAASATRHTNTLRTSDQKTKDTEVVLSPTLVYRQDIGRHQAQVGYSANVVGYKDLSSQDVSSHNLDAAVNLWPGELLSFSAFGGYGKSYETHGASGARLTGDLEPDEYDIWRYGITALLGRPESTMQFSAGYNRASWRYTNNDQGDRDRDEDTFTGRVYYNYSPITSIFLEANFTDIGYLQQVPMQDSTETAYLVGVRAAPTAALSGEVAYGVMEKDYDDPLIEDFDGPTYRARVRWVPVDRLGLNAFASRTTEESGELTSDYFVSTLYGLGVDYELTSHIRTWAFYNWIEDDYPETTRLDKSRDWAIGLDYTVTDWLTLGFQYGRTNRDSNVPDAVYDDEYIGLTAGLQTQFDGARR